MYPFGKFVRILQQEIRLQLVVIAMDLELSKRIVV
jgi:hypothetical protein